MNDNTFLKYFRVSHPESGRKLRMYCDQPGVQVYTSNNLPDPDNSVWGLAINYNLLKCSYSIPLLLADLSAWQETSAGGTEWR